MKIHSRQPHNVGGLVTAAKTFFPGLEAFTIRPGNTAITSEVEPNEDKSLTYTVTISLTLDSDQYLRPRTIEELLKGAK